jgi:dTDP-glucose 4,6-dehydratase
MLTLLVSGGAGFIGSCFVRMLANVGGYRIINFDSLSYAGNLDNVAPVAGNPNYTFVHGDLRDAAVVDRTVAELKPDIIVHFAAESHVDRSILSPAPVIDTNLRGTFHLLDAARKNRIGRFVHISTDEVYGSIDAPADADESFPLNPSSPYSATKAGSDLLALSYYKTFGLPVIVTRASNNYGPYQFPEKLIPLMISNALDGRPLPVYGDGQQVRDWLFVEDHCRAILAVLHKGREGEVYNIGGNESLPNLEVVHRILRLTGRSEDAITYVGDRPGHDRRYALSSEKIHRETGWAPEVQFAKGLQATIEWYRQNTDWMSRVKSGEYMAYYADNYGQRTDDKHPTL